MGRSLDFACQENVFSQVLGETPLQAKIKIPAELGPLL